ncbi:hypothetical protein [Flavobacterium lindanitolerans]|uniref:hypothetical protein n=1 Tax=Flavobacterium lindanitolerans TaxID=428988 RepID=UPI0031E064BD
MKNLMTKKSLLLFVSGIALVLTTLFASNKISKISDTKYMTPAQYEQKYGK